MSDIVIASSIYSGPQNICGVQDCNQLLLSRGVSLTVSGVVCGRCSRAIYNNIGMKMRLVIVSAHRKRMLKRLFRDFSPICIPLILSKTFLYVGEDLGELQPSAKWAHLLDISGFPYATCQRRLPIELPCYSPIFQSKEEERQC